MGNQQHFEIINKGSSTWNRWRKENHLIKPDLSNCDLRGLQLPAINLTYTNLQGACLDKALLKKAQLQKSQLQGASLQQADLNNASLLDANLERASLHNAFLMGALLTNAQLSGAQLEKAQLWEAHLQRATLIQAHLRNADLSGADLRGALLMEANLQGACLQRTLLTEAFLVDANLMETEVYQIIADDVVIDGALQNDLVITSIEQPTVIVDSLKIAKLMMLLIQHPDLMAQFQFHFSKCVLLIEDSTTTLFSNAVKQDIRGQGYIPLTLFYAKNNLEGTVKMLRLLVHFARCIVVHHQDPDTEIQELLANCDPGQNIPIYSFQSDRYQHITF